MMRRNDKIKLNLMKRRKEKINKEMKEYTGREVRSLKEKGALGPCTVNNIWSILISHSLDLVSIVNAM